MNFENKTALSTGAASGMGLLFSQNFAALGGNVVMCDVNEAVLNEKVAEINAQNKGRAIGIVCDVRDYAQVKADNMITRPVAVESLSLLEIDPHGLDEMDIKILETICSKFGGGPVGLSTIAVSVGEEPDTSEEAYEPFLIMEGYRDRTPKGRVATPLAWKRLGLSPASGGLTQPSLF